MLNPKTFFPYLFGLVSLIISLGIVSQGKLVEAEPLPSPAPSATPLPKSEPFPGAARLARCEAVSQPKFFFYKPTLTPDISQHLIISGTVYASDLTPLPDTLIEVWQSDDTQLDQPVLFNIAKRTEKTGHYEFTPVGFNRSKQLYLHYRITHRDYCPLLMHLRLVVEPIPRPSKQIFAQVVVTGPVLHGPVDIVLPVPPPKP
jgi:hypothetical protein